LRAGAHCSRCAIRQDNWVLENSSSLDFHGKGFP
jgi:hypothetical protein